MRWAWLRVLAAWGVVAVVGACAQAATGAGSNEGPGAHASASPGAGTGGGSAAGSRKPVPTPTRLSFLAQLRADGGADHLNLDGVPVGAVCTAQLVFVPDATSGVASGARTQTATYPPLTAPPIRPDKPGATTGSVSFTLPAAEDPPPGPFTWNYDCKLYDRVQTHFVVFEGSGHLSGHG